ncbi:EAL domain-containing protein [Rubellimicrobium rubrum]|uniref:EAL domain-containing protein n=1 Tax=Rubellimicrobium rubrum TaxID=2585369 RepID=A0A5C4MPH6_9RHOB|nr:EAL domain-containing protein [Rubellimicrobium rubrum]TNC47736.1 EAL domain-containing protein [Rubellimicrobium rubrum]
MALSLAEILNLKTGPSRQLLQRKMHSIASALRELFGMEVAFISRLENGWRHFEVTDVHPGLECLGISPGASARASESYCLAVAEGRLPELIQDAQQLQAAADFAATRAIPVGAHLSVPIRLSQGRVFGTVCAFRRQGDHSLNERDLTVFRLCAEVLALDIDDVERREQALMDRHARVQQILDAHDFQIHFQPVMALTSDVVVGHEALLRVEGESDIAAFIEAAHEVGLGVSLEEAAVQRAVEQYHPLAQGHSLSLNLSPKALLAGEWDRILPEASRSRIVLELTEHASVADYPALVEALRPLRASGVRVAVDDVGAGFASLLHVTRLRPDQIKIDRSLVSSLDADHGRFQVVATLAGLAARIGAVPVAEGVERPAEVQALREIGVELVQGYYFGRPALLKSQSNFTKNHDDELLQHKLGRAEGLASACIGAPNTTL